MLVLLLKTNPYLHLSNIAVKEYTEPMPPKLLGTLLSKISKKIVSSLRLSAVGSFNKS